MKKNYLNRMIWSILIVWNIHDISVGRDHGWFLVFDWVVVIFGLFVIIQD